MTLDFINVGYGDAILVRSGSFAMLVDCGDMTVGDGGPGSQRISAGEFLRREGIEKLDLLVLTHLHRDHSGGLTELLQTVACGEILWKLSAAPGILGQAGAGAPGIFRRGAVPAGIPEHLPEGTGITGGAGRRNHVWRCPDSVP